MFGSEFSAPLNEFWHLRPLPIGSFSFSFQTAPIKVILSPFDLLPFMQCAYAHMRSLNSRGVRTFSLSSFPPSVSLPLCVTIILPHVLRNSGRHVGRSRRKKWTDNFFGLFFQLSWFFLLCLFLLCSSVFFLWGAAESDERWDVDILRRLPAAKTAAGLQVREAGRTFVHENDCFVRHLYGMHWFFSERVLLKLPLFAFIHKK